MFLSPALTFFCTLKKQKITKITNLLKYAQNRQKNILELNFIPWIGKCSSNYHHSASSSCQDQRVVVAQGEAVLHQES